MARMTDPSDALNSFQQALRHGEVRPQRCETDSNLFVHLDHPNGEVRITYVRIYHETVTALASFILGAPIDGLPCFSIGYAVPEKFRNQGRAKDIIEAGIAEMKYGLFSRANISSFYVEAVIGVDNKPSRHVAAATISFNPLPVTDHVSGLPAFQYVRKIENNTV
ncbi:MAG TPA: hypothetical protein VGC27_01770, partial [Rhizomicrobium sp.]